MSDEPTRELPPDDGATEEYPTLVGGAAPPDSRDELAPSEDDDLWPVRGPAHGIRLAVPAAVLTAVLLVAAGFWGGAYVEKRHGGSGSSAASALASRFRAATTGTGTSTTGTTTTPFGGFGGTTAAATGTISVVDGSTLYVLTSTGGLVKVTLAPSTTVTRDASAGSSALRPGDTVVIEGSTGKNGNVTATSVSATAPGVSSGAGRFGGFGGTGG